VPEIANMIFSGEDLAKRASAQALAGIRGIIEALRSRELDDDADARQKLKTSADDLFAAARQMEGIDLGDLPAPVRASYEDFRQLTHHLAHLTQQQSESDFSHPIIDTLGPVVTHFLFKGATLTSMARQAKP
jgi:hypothetical protein